MASWSTKRKLAYSSTVIFVLILLVVLPVFYFLYKPPTCTDNKMNGNEIGIDCGGSCIKLCQNSFIPPKIGWGNAKFEKVNEGFYNVAAYIINPNINGAALDVPYKIALYDSSGSLIVEKRGKVTLYAHRNSLAYEPAVDVGKRIPVKATFEFIESPNWFKSHDAIDGLVIIDKRYNEDNNSSSLEIELENKTLYSYNDIQVSVILYDINGNAIGFSRTNIDSISEKSGREIAPFTWSFGRDGKVTSIEVLPMILPTIDR